MRQSECRIFSVSKTFRSSVVLCAALGQVVVQRCSHRSPPDPCSTYAAFARVLGEQSFRCVSDTDNQRVTNGYWRSAFDRWPVLIRRPIVLAAIVSVSLCQSFATRALFVYVCVYVCVSVRVCACVCVCVRCHDRIHGEMDPMRALSCFTRGNEPHVPSRIGNHLRR